MANKAKKTLKKIVDGSKNISFNDFVHLVEAFGFRLDRINGSHHYFVHRTAPTGFPIQPDQNGQAKHYQLRQFIKLVEQYNLTLVDSESNGRER